MRVHVLHALKALSGGAVAVFMVGWVTAFLARPSPHWLFPAMVATGAVGFLSTILYHLVNHSFSEPIEDIHWEIETPTTLGNLIRQNWVGPLFIWIVFDVVAIVVLRDQLGLESNAAVPLGLAIGTAACWVFVLAHARGWIHDE